MNAELASTFRNAMANLGSAVSIVTSDGPHGKVGITATAVCSVSDSPPMLVCCINRRSLQCTALKANGVLCVNTLAADQDHLSSVFAGQTGHHGEDRFQEGRWTVMSSGAPVLDNALAAFDCRIASVMDAGSHSVILCEVLDVSSLDGDGLVYFRRTYHRLSNGSANACRSPAT